MGSRSSAPKKASRIKTVKLPAQQQLLLNVIPIKSAWESDADNEDFGGSQIHNNTLIGIVSWGQACSAVGFPMDYARVAHSVDWIQETSNSQTKTTADSAHFFNERMFSIQYKSSLLFLFSVTTKWQFHYILSLFGCSINMNFLKHLTILISNGIWCII